MKCQAATATLFGMNDHFDSVARQHSQASPINLRFDRLLDAADKQGDPGARFSFGPINSRQRLRRRKLLRQHRKHCLEPTWKQFTSWFDNLAKPSYQAKTPREGNALGG